MSNPTFNRAEVEAIQSQAIFLRDLNNTGLPGSRFAFAGEQWIAHNEVAGAAAFALDVMDGTAEDIEDVTANDALWNAIDPVWINYSSAIAQANAGIAA